MYEVEDNRSKQRHNKRTMRAMRSGVRRSELALRNVTMWTGMALLLSVPSATAAGPVFL
jgi:hypothetical protein